MKQCENAVRKYRDVAAGWPTQKVPKQETKNITLNTKDQEAFQTTARYPSTVTLVLSLEKLHFHHFFQHLRPALIPL